MEYPAQDFFSRVDKGIPTEGKSFLEDGLSMLIKKRFSGNMAGPRANRDPKIYEDTLQVLKAFYQTADVDEAPQRFSPILPRTMDEALDTMISALTLRDRTRMERMQEHQLIDLHQNLGAWIRDRFGLSEGNPSLVASCRLASGIRDLNEFGASSLITRKLWERLKSLHSLRVVGENRKPAGNMRPPHRNPASPSQD